MDNGELEKAIKKYKGPIHRLWSNIRKTIMRYDGSTPLYSKINQINDSSKVTFADHMDFEFWGLEHLAKCVIQNKPEELLKFGDACVATGVINFAGMAYNKAYELIYKKEPTKEEVIDKIVNYRPLTIRSDAVNIGFGFL